MHKTRRVLRSFRFKYTNSFTRASRCSNIFLLAIFLFIVTVLFLVQERDSKDDYIEYSIDEFQAANYDKVKYSTAKLITRKQGYNNKKTTKNVTETNFPIVIKITNDPNAISNKRSKDVTKFHKIAKDPKTTKVRKTTKDPKATKVPIINRDILKPRFPLKLINVKKPVIKVFYKGKYPHLQIKTTEKKQVSSKKLTYRDVFFAMAHPRLFPSTTENIERIQDAHIKTGLNDWIQANSPRDKQKLLVYSAYWDDRFEGSNCVRVMVVMVTKNPPTVYCRLQMEDDKFNDVPVSKKVMNEHWRLKYASYFIQCEVSKNLAPPTKVFLSVDRNFTYSAMVPVYQNRKNTVSPRGDMAVCVKPFHYNYDRATWLVEFIELHRIMGVEHFFFYNHSVGENVDALLRHYMRQKIVTVLPWNLPVRSQKEIRTEGIFSSLNDCVYRTMYLFHYVILLDFDEYIIPREHDNYLDLLEKLEEDNKRIRGKPGSFVFRNTFFYLYWENDTAAYGAEPEKPPHWLPYFVTQYKTRRLSTSMKTGSRSKYIVVPERVIEVGNHVVWRHTSGSRAIQVPDSAALLHHYRICEFGGYTCLKKPSLVDRTANKFSEELLRRAIDQCIKIYPQLDGKCPVSPPLGSPW